jgi:hypothetical protein
MRRHLLATAVILTVAPGCDNVAWGGVEVRWEPPATAAPGTPADVPEAEVTEEPEAPEIPYPLLLAGMRDGTRATLVVVGELRPEGIAEATATSTSTGATNGSEWILFTEGVRVGRLTADEVDVASDFCPATASLSGTIEVVPTATAFDRILALPAAEARSAAYANPRPLTHDYNQRVASLTFAQEAIPRLGAPWPEGGVLPTRLDIQAFQPVGAAERSLAATYLVRDQLAVARPAAGAYSLFILSSPVGGQVRETFEWYNAADLDGKKAPRYFAHLDWDGDGAGEVVLDVFGADRRWHAVLEQRENSWERTFESPCGAGPSAGR